MFDQLTQRPGLRAVSCAALTTLLLASCGGGGSGSDAGTTSATASSLKQSTPTTTSGSTTTGNTSTGNTNNNNTATSPATGTTTGSTTTTPTTTTDTTTTGGTATTGTTTGGTTTASSTPSPYGQTATAWQLTFAEDFNNSSLDDSRWNDHIWYEGGNSTQNYTVENGALKIWPQRDASGNFFNRTIDTDGKYYQTYGYFEIEAKLPYGKGTWPAFWLFNHIGNRRPEIDIMEAYAGGGPNSGWSDSALHPTAYGATIWLDASNNGGFKMIQTPDLSAGFHKYAIKWEPNKQTFYFDGKEVYSANVTMGDPMYIMLDLWFGSASGQPDGTTPTGKGNSYEVNYVRAWSAK